MAWLLKCYSLLLGARNTAGAGRRFRKTDDARIHAITFRHFPDGFTVLNADGGWFDPARKHFVAEESRQIVVCATSRAALRRWCAELASALQQKELLVVELGPASSFKAATQRLQPRRGRKS
jgi:hypothetical protein